MIIFFKIFDVLILFCVKQVQNPELQVKYLTGSRVYQPGQILLKHNDSAKFISDIIRKTSGAIYTKLCTCYLR